MYIYTVCTYMVFLAGESLNIRCKYGVPTYEHTHTHRHTQPCSSGRWHSTPAQHAGRKYINAHTHTTLQTWKMASNTCSTCWTSQHAPSPTAKNPHPPHTHVGAAAVNRTITTTRSKNNSGSRLQPCSVLQMTMVVLRR